MSRSILRAILPAKILAMRDSRRHWSRQARYGSLTREQAFDSIYFDGEWGHNEGQLYSGEGSYGVFAESYLRFVRGFIGEKGIATIADLGCGDFNIGSQLHGSVEEYFAFDVSSEILARNRENYGHLDNVVFEHKDACVDRLPHVDLILVRQVLQHLGNAEIEAFLQNIERSGSKYALISEHCCDLERMREPNKEMAAHGPNTRVYMGSGVMIDKAPFSRDAELVASVVHPESDGECLYTWIWKLG